MRSLIINEKGAIIAKECDEIVAFVLAASWKFWYEWPLFQYMTHHLKDINYKATILTVDNSYQYGPICIDKRLRGTGLLEELFTFSLHKMSKKYQFLVTFVNIINERSYVAHSKKLKLDTNTIFEFNGNKYYLMLCKTK